MVVPKENLVVVFTSKLSGDDAFFPARMLDKYILPAIVANESLGANETAQYELSLLSEPPRQVVKPKPVPELPAIAREISHETYSLDSNPWKYDNFKLVFDSDKEYAKFSYTAKEKDVVHYEVGLNNVYRLTESNGDTYAAVGSWTTPDTFVIDYELVGYSTRDKWILTFDNEEVAVEEVGVTGVYNYGGKRINKRE